MTGAHEVLIAVTTVLCVAALTTVLCRLLRQPVVLGYILAGLIIGPHVPVPLVADRGIVEILSEFGVILLMFSLGLDFSIGRLLSVGPTAGFTALLQSSVMVWLGFVVTRLLGWSTLESLFAGAALAISSTTIIAKAFDEEKVRGGVKEIVVGILIVEDLIAVLMIAALTAVSTGSGLSPSNLVVTTGRLIAFLVALVAAGLLVVPPTNRGIGRLGRAETTLVASVGLCFAVSLLAQEFGYSVALGAFIAGSLIAESGEAPAVERLIHPVRDLFAAIFFVSVGMLIDPALIARHWLPALLLTAVVLVGMIGSVSLGVFLTGNGLRPAVQSGMSMAQIGEFSFIIAALGLSLDVTRPFLYAVIVAVSAATTLTTPWLIRSAGPAAAWVDRKLPKPLQTFAALYGSWMEDLRSTFRGDSRMAAVRRLAWHLLLDAAIVTAILVGVSVEMGEIVSFARARFGLHPSLARPLAIVGAFLLSAPFWLGIVRVGGRLSVLLGEIALPAASKGKPDLAAAPRRALVLTLQLGGVLLVGAPVLAVTQPFLPGLPGAIVLVLVLALLGIGFWRSATNLQGHVRAGAQVLVEALAKQARGGGDGGAAGARAPSRLPDILPGLGAPESVEIPAEAPVVGKSLAEINLRGTTGATILAITRGEERILIPLADTRLHAGDLVALVGTHGAIDAARALLAGEE
jgi:CPA2 family monovalent cation:H+ antiporter-2